MKRKVRRLKTCSAQTAGHGDRGTPQDTLGPDDDEEKHPQRKSGSSGRMSTAVCRLCHGKFSPRSLRHAFNKWPQDSQNILDSSDQSPPLFHTDFQRLVGVQLDRDPQLSEFICKKCHTKFYKCHNILLRFLQRVNLPPVSKGNRKNVKFPNSSDSISSGKPPSLTSDPKCLHSLVSWAHRHGESCRSCPDLKEVLEGQCWGSVKAVWGCMEGHRFIMDAQTASAPYLGLWVGNDEEEEGSTGNQSLLDGTEQNRAQDDWISSEDFPEEAPSPAVDPLQNRTADSDLSDRVMSDEELQETRGRGGPSDEEMFDPFLKKRTSRLNVTKRRQSPKSLEEPRMRKKPGPKPGWKNKFRPKGEELPNIYKCPYQGCTAVYRAPDGLKKHIKEHHEDMKERPCPHPGCNKVFMIDRYLQRHIKLIHTEERNYICDQCGQTFKQRKHLSVHQMRHSGAKPLQCEVCGFQCRQRASLKYHMTKHKAEADLDFECLMCRKRFEKAHNLNVHMSMVHPLVLAEVQQGASRPQPVGLTGEALQQDQDR